MKKASEQYTSITVTKNSKKLFDRVHALLGKRLSVMAFFEEDVETYRKYHCPECNEKLRVRRCPCKDPETM